MILSSDIRARGGEVVITGLNDDLRTLFTLAKLTTRFTISEWGDGLAGQPARLKPPPPGPLADAAAEQRPDIPPLS